MHRYFIYCRKSTEDDDRQAISLESQRFELIRFAELHNLFVAEILFESRSARALGRPVFNRMLQRIAHGEVDGIIAWHPDRLARNAVDGGQVVHFLDIEKIADLRFPTFTFENTPQGKFMLMIMFGHSKYEVDNLSEIVKRGNRMKRELGWLPGPAPLGYLNIHSDSGTRVIGRDPERFPIVKQLWQLFLTENFSGSELLSVATDRLRLRARRTLRKGGGCITKSTLYRMFRNPFYTGHLVFKDRWHQGSHEPMISVEEFNRAQKILRGMRVRPRRYRFAYSGFIRCGNCDSSVIGEPKVNRYGSRYTYYHCTHGKPSMPCRERSIEERELERQVIAFFAEERNDNMLVSQTSLRYLLATRAQKVRLTSKRIEIDLKLPR